MTRLGRTVLLVGAMGALGVQQDAGALPAQGDARAERFFRAVRTLLREGPRDRHAPEAVVERCDGRAELAFEWVRDRTAWVDYDGVLRGPRGVLMDRVGNSLDRALLLAELCTQSGEEVRLARATLDPELVEGLAERVRPLRDLADRFASSTGGAESLGDWAARVRLPGRAVTTAAAAARLVAERSASVAEERAADATRALAAALGDVVPTEDRMAPAVAREHTWVQIRRGDTWVDLDPLVAAAAWGEALTPATDTLAVDELGDDDFHRLIVRVVAEQWTSSGRREHVLVERTWRSHETVGETIQVYNVPLYAAPDLEQLRGSASWDADVCAQVVQEREWLPVVALGDDDLWQRGIRASGEMNESPQTSATGKAMGRAIDAIGGAGAEPTDPHGFTAEWIEVERFTPGTEPRLVRREVFDLVGASARAGAGGDDAPVPVAVDDAQVLSRNLTLLGNVALLPLASEVPAEYVDRLALYRIWSQRDLFVQSAEVTDEGGLEDVLGSAARVPAFHAGLWSFAVNRRAWARDAESTYVGSTNLVAWHDRMVVDGSGAVRFQSGFDVVLNDVADQRAPRAAFLARLRQGVVDTVTEAVLLERAGGGERSSIDLAAAGGELALYRDGETLERELDPWPAELRARMREELAAGAVVVVPRRPAADAEPWQLGFWRVDPRDGSCLGIGGQGWGAAVRQEVPSYVQVQVAQIKFMFAALEAYQCVGEASDEESGKACIKKLVCDAAEILAGLGGDPRVEAVIGGVCSQ